MTAIGTTAALVTVALVFVRVGRRCLARYRSRQHAKDLVESWAADEPNHLGRH